LAVSAQLVQQAQDYYLTPIAVRLNAYWGLDGAMALNSSDVDILVTHCANLLAFDDMGASQFCSIFQDDEIVAWDYLHDVRLYYQYGYGAPAIVDAAFPILRDIYLTMHHVIQRESIEHGKIVIGQHQTLLPFLALLV
jgi:hypothetical protein